MTKKNISSAKDETQKKTKIEETKIEETKKITELKNMILKMQEESQKKDSQLEKLMSLVESSNKPQDNRTRQITADDVVVSVGTLAITGVDLISPNQDVVISVKRGEQTDTTERDLREVFKNKRNKSFFENGICFFVDNNDEEINPIVAFRLKQKKKLDDDSIIEILKEKNQQTLFKKLNELTDNKNSLDITHTLFHIICELETKGKLSFFSRTDYDVIEAYFKVSISQGIINLGMYKGVPTP